ncbi:hypothetical protein QYE47_23245 [Pseudomonas sp. 2,4-D]|uniref:hypothetical protein n=1 Tax=Pseudomonas sp. 2,4-D TaxID=3058433 RepID=UPI00260F8CBB|nr:hypothetical protein [Pseudomonas sp. 2,4-D]MDN4515441.1 hypothetical protein [Pseudomonas sp. 2,4-D]
MTPAQERTVLLLRREQFTVACEGREVVRVTRNGDNRVIMRDGTQKRGHHVDFAQVGRVSRQRG